MIKSITLKEYLITLPKLIGEMAVESYTLFQFSTF